MAEYAGYVASAPVDFGAITSGLVSNIISIDQAKREEDRKTLKEFDKNYDDNVKQIKDFQLSQSQSFNDMVSNLGDQVKKSTLNAYNTGNTREVNRVTANLKSGVNNINSAKESINENIKKIRDLTLSKEGVSPIGNTYFDLYTDATNFSNGGFVVLPDGTIPYVKYDSDGKIISQNSFFDPATIAKVETFYDPNVDYESDLNKWVDKIGSYTDEQGKVTITSPLKNPAFPKAKLTKIEDLTSTPKNTARFLSSVGGYASYKDEKQKEELLKNKKLSEDKLIKVELVDGIPQPILTDKQMEDAKKLAAEQIDQRVSYKKTLDEDRGANPLGALSVWLQKEQYKSEQDLKKQMRPLVTKANIADKIYASNNPSDWGPLKEAARLRGIKSPTITNTTEGYKILYGIPKGKSKVVEIARLNSAGEIYAYTTGKENLIDAIGEYDRAKEYMSGNEPQPEQAPNVISLQEATSNAAKAGMTLDQYKNWLKTTRNTEVR
jgi:hypothetical protein